MKDLKKNHSILIIEDEISMQQLLAYLLEHEGYQVDRAPLGATALAMMQNKTFDLIIQDMRLPDMDGISLLQQIKKSYPNIQVVVITAFSNWQIAVEAMRLGAFD